MHKKHYSKIKGQIQIIGGEIYGILAHGTAYFEQLPYKFHYFTFSNLWMSYPSIQYHSKVWCKKVKFLMF